MPATIQQRKTANQIWDALENRCLFVPDFPIVDYYAVWGLAHAILTDRTRDAVTYEGWMNKLYDVWAEVSERHPLKRVDNAEKRAASEALWAEIAAEQHVCEHPCLTAGYCLWQD